MRYLVVCAFLAASTAFSASRSDLTLVLAFDKQSADAAVGEMKQELAELFRSSGFDLDFKLAQELGAYPQFERVVSIRFLGECRMDKVPWQPPPQGSLGFSRAVDGKVLPFIEIQCDLVRDLIRSATAAEGSRRDLLLGRALGRVVAHELYHVLIRTSKHGSGLTQPTLNAKELVQEELAFDSTDFAHIAGSP